QEERRRPGVLGRESGGEPHGSAAGVEGEGHPHLDELGVADQVLEAGTRETERLLARMPCCSHDSVCAASWTAGGGERERLVQRGRPPAAPITPGPRLHSDDRISP